MFPNQMEGNREKGGSRKIINNLEATNWKIEGIMLSVYDQEFGKAQIYHSYKVQDHPTDPW